MGGGEEDLSSKEEISSSTGEDDVIVGFVGLVSHLEGKIRLPSESVSTEISNSSDAPTMSSRLSTEVSFSLNIGGSSVASSVIVACTKKIALLSKFLTKFQFGKVFFC